ncbi:HD domain-containing protein [uncultured Tissierella sp.]|jgi:putative nucleotidyltransferase with HDIG domain|uniref:HD domain-containing protein n=1 Tax=uncultured Tissierella sp. TaxID=448160 RepID=UPI0028062D80|nr:HD domain-containing protein [uncultured Tissierella sp.]MDU5081817.1 HD domain-containing protein [Bacillota bacterium]
MTYSVDRERLNYILGSNKDIKDYKDEILRIIPELIICVDCEQNMPAHIYNVFDHILETVNRVDSDLILRVTALLHDIGKPYKKIVINNVDSFKGHEEVSEIIANLILARLGYDEDFINKVCKLIKYHDYQILPTVEGVKESIDLVGDELISYLFCFQKADLLAHSEQRYKPLLPKLSQAKEIYESLCGRSS